MLSFTPFVARFSFVLLAALSFAAAPAQAREICRVLDGFSLDEARGLIKQGDRYLDRVGDCQDSNASLCRLANERYEMAQWQINGVFQSAKGDNCTICDLDMAWALADTLDNRSALLAQMYYPNALFQLEPQLREWAGKPACPDLGSDPITLPGLAPIPGPLPAPAPGAPIVGTPVSNCNSQGGYATSRLNASPGLTIPGVSYFADCEGRCDQNDWCRSFDMDFNNSICILHDRTKEEVGLLPAPDGYSHFVCAGR